MMAENDFALNLKAIRISAGKSVSDVSKYLTSLGKKASEKTIYSWESGRSQPTPDTLLDMCMFYGTTDVLAAFGYKKSPSTVEPAPEENQDLQIMNLLSKMQPEQKILLLALLRTTIAQNQGKPVAEMESVGETILQLEHQGQT